MKIMSFIEFFMYESLSVELTSIKEKYKENLEKFNVYEFTDKLSIDLIKVKEKGSGTGTAVMKELCSYADKKGLIMILSPSKEFGASSVSRLKDFYKRFGFVENKGKNKEFGIFETMYRKPKDNK